MPTTTVEKIEVIRNTAFAKSERRWWLAFALVISATLASSLVLSGVLPQGSGLESVVVVVSVLMPILAVLARNRSSHWASRGDVCRRAFLYRNSLGIDLSIDEKRSIALWPAKTPLSAVTVAAPYFESSKEHGAGRLADNVAESAFITSELARLMAAFLLLASLGVILLCLAALASLSTLKMTPTNINNVSLLVGIGATIALTFVVGEVAITWLAYRSLADGAKDSFKEASRFSENKETEVTAAMLIAERYSIALASNLPLPYLLYRWHHERIEKAYKDALGQTTK